MSAPIPAPSTPTTEPPARTHPPRALGVTLLTAGAVSVVGAVLPWRTRDSIGVTGLGAGSDGSIRGGFQPGYLVIAAAAVLMALGVLVVLARSGRLAGALTAAAAALGLTIVVLYYVLDVAQVAGTTSGMGLWLSGLGMVLGLVVGVRLVLQRRRHAADVLPPGGPTV